MEATPVIVTYVPLIIAAVSLLGFAVTLGVLIVGRVFRLGKFFADFTTLQETVATNRTELQETIAANRTELQETIAANRTELQKEIADNRSEIQALRQELRDGINRIEAGLQELRGYFVSHLEHHGGFPADDD